MDDALMPREDRPTRHSGLWPGIHSGPAAQASVLSPMHRNRLVDVVQYFDDLLIGPGAGATSSLTYTCAA